MRTSDNLENLATALSAAQAEIKPAAMTGKNPHLKNRYATLNDIIDVARGPLTKNGLAYIQMPTNPADPTAPFIGLTTRLLHKSGEWVEDDLYFPVDAGSNRAVSSAQVAGSMLTYMRRYALASMLGIVADEDADGNDPPAQAKTRPATAPTGTPPVDALLYADGSFVDNNPKAIATYEAYVAAHDGKAPENVHNLRNWYKQQHTNGNAQPAATDAAQVDLFGAEFEERQAAAKAALETAMGQMD